MTIEEFCDKHNACPDGRNWALANCKDMQEVWETARPKWLVWVATRSGVLTDRELRLFAVWAARQVQHLMLDQRSITALDVAERHANGLATDGELNAAYTAAWQVANQTDEWTPAWIAAWAADSNANSAAVWITVWSVAHAAWLRANTTPTFT